MTDWTIETDHEAKARERTGAINGRYQVCHPDEGLIDTADKIGEAFSIGDRYAMRTLPDGSPYCTTPFAVEVYDRMARNGGCRIWRRQPKRGTYSMKKFDKFSLDARWECVELRAAAAVRVRG